MLAVAFAAFCVCDLIANAANIFLRDLDVSSDVAVAALFVIMFLMLAGPANRNNANDNTSGVITVLETARAMPREHRDKVCFVFFDMEEQGLIGSAAYRLKHRKETGKQTVLNLDCVGDGDHILFMPFKKAVKDQALLEKLNCGCGESDRKHLIVKTKGFRFYPSDQSNFPKAVAIGAFRRTGIIGCYCDKIHTKRDTVLEEKNVNILRAALTSLICCDS